MSTAKYANRVGKRAASRGPAFDPETPVAGCYRIRLNKGGPPVALRIWFGPPLDPETRAPMTERSPRWQAQTNNLELVPVMDFWPRCARVRISKAEHDRIAGLSATMDAAHPFYDPRRPIDRLTAPLPF